MTLAALGLALTRPCPPSLLPLMTPGTQALLALDTRSERTQTRILSPATWKE